MLKKDKVWNPDLWRPIFCKSVEIDEAKIMTEKLKKINSFLDYQALEDRYEVRGIMPKAPKYQKRLVRKLTKNKWNK